MANDPVDDSFFEAKGFPQSSLYNYPHLEPTLFSHPYLYSLSWGRPVIHLFCKSNIQYQCPEPGLDYNIVNIMDYPKAGMHATVLGHMYSWGTKVHENKCENLARQRKQMVSVFLHCDKTEYNRILHALGAGIYICTTVHAMEIMRSGITRKLL